MKHSALRKRTNRLSSFLRVEQLEDRVTPSITGFGGGANGPGIPGSGIGLPQKFFHHVSADLMRLAVPGLGGVPTGLDASEMTFDQQGRVLVRVGASDVQSLQPQLEKMGMHVVGSSPSNHLFEGYIPVGILPNAEGMGHLGLWGISPLPRPITRVGVANSQADYVHEADRVRATLPDGFDGTGVTIGVLSDSFDTGPGSYAADRGTGDLPGPGNPFGRTTPVNVLSDFGGGSDEGRAMLQLIHDLAPGADLAFATAFNTPTIFADNIRALRDAGADVIVDDIGYLTDPFFQDGVIAQAVDEVFADGVAYLSAGGNDADQSYESTNIQTGADTLFAGTFFDFDPGAGVDTRQLITLANGEVFQPSFQWDDPYLTGGVDTDWDIYLALAGTTTLVAGSAGDNPLTQQPVEFFGFQNTTGATQTYELIINLFSGPAGNRIKYIDFGSGDTVDEYFTNSSTIFGHPAAAGGLAVGAVPYFNRTVPEGFTSLGPTTSLFEANGSPRGAPEVRQTPQISAADGTDTSFFGGAGSDVDGTGFPNFFGTSAAAPHAAAIAALVRQANPAFSPQEVYDRLADSARDIHTIGFDNLTGAGMLNAYAAIYGDVVPANPGVVSEGFESGALPVEWEVNGTGVGRTRVTSNNSPDSGAFHLTMDTDPTNILFSLNEAILHFDATASVGDVLLSFRQREFGEEDNVMPASFTGSGAFDGVALSVNGIDWFRIVSLTGPTSVDSYQSFNFNLSQIAADNGVALGADTRVKFQQFDGSAIPADGFAFDRIEVGGLGTIDALVVNPDEVITPDQRSRVTDLAVDIVGHIVTAPSAAFTLTRNGVDPFTVTVASLNYADGVTRIRLALTPGELEFDSLPDGNYVLEVNGALVLDAFGRGIDADDSGTAGGVAALNFHRRFGDRDGDQDVDGLDFFFFRQSYRGDATELLFDFDNDGGVLNDSEDLSAFVTRWLNQG